MPKTATLNIRIDPVTKEAAEKLFSNFGITISDAVNIFLHQSILSGGLPFEIKIPQYNSVTLAAMEEAKELSRTGKGLSVDELFKDLEI